MNNSRSEDFKDHAQKYQERLVEVTNSLPALFQISLCSQKLCLAKYFKELWGCNSASASISYMPKSEPNNNPLYI